MSTLARLIHRIPATHRSYSSFGGGRFFNSSKSSKSPVVAAKGKSSGSDRSPKDSSGNNNTSAKASAGAAAAAAAPAKPGSSTPTPNNTNNANAAKPETTAAAATTTSPEPVREAFRHGRTAPSAYLPPNPYHNYLSASSPHPTIAPQDFKIHQFFSLHRPLLLLSNPTSIFASAPPDAPLFSSSLAVEDKQATAVVADELPPTPFTSLNLDGSYATPYGAMDGDAEAARQLHHAMTMHRVGGVVSWEQTLKTLGLDVSQSEERVQLREQWEREWEEVMMDSVKRKRKKKMKKHKLKKRRRDTRSQRMRIGR